MNRKETDKAEIDLGTEVLKAAIKKGKPVFSYEENDPEVLVDRPLTAEEKKVEAVSCLETAYKK